MCGKCERLWLSSVDVFVSFLARIAASLVQPLFCVARGVALHVSDFAHHCCFRITFDVTACVRNFAEEGPEDPAHLPRTNDQSWRQFVDCHCKESKFFFLEIFLSSLFKCQMKKKALRGASLTTIDMAGLTAVTSIGEEEFLYQCSRLTPINTIGLSAVTVAAISAFEKTPKKPPKSKRNVVFLNIFLTLWSRFFGFHHHSPREHLVCFS